MKAIAVTLLLALGAATATAATPDDGNGLVVSVEMHGGVVHTTADVTIPASNREVWEVLTDFDNLPRFISNITASKVISRSGNVLQVSQAGKAGFGPFTFEFHSVRAIRLFPIERFESRMVEGNMKRFNGTTRLESVAGATHIHFESDAVPDTTLPLSLARSTIESETREHYQEISREVMRRKNPASAR